MSRKEVLTNEQIRSKIVRLIDDSGNQLGLVPLRAAIQQAKDQGLTLVQISAGVNDNPVCRITDYGKYIFGLKKHQREMERRRRDMMVEVREIQLRPNTDENDLRIKSRKASEFLSEGDKVKVVVRFRGRERSHKDIGRKTIDQFVSLVEGGTHDTVTDTGRDLSIMIVPTISKAEVLKSKGTNQSDNPQE